MRLTYDDPFAKRKTFADEIPGKFNELDRSEHAKAFLSRASWCHGQVLETIIAGSKMQKVSLGGF